MAKQSSGFLNQCKQLLSSLFGQWISPPWIKALKQKCAANKDIFFMTLCLIIILMIGSYKAYRWYQHLPKPTLITAEIIPPSIAPVEKELRPEPLRIRFGVLKDKHFENRSVAPLNRVGKPIKEGITVSPALEGEWRWDSDSELLFTPKNDWLAGQAYRIKFAPSLFASQAKFKSYDYKFATQALAASIAELKFYQDPQDPKVQQLVATVNFNFPVDARSVEDNLHLIHQQLKKDKLDLNAKSYKYSIRFDEHKRTAYIQSETLKLDTQAYYIALVLEKGIKAAVGNTKTKNEVAQKVLIPDANNIVKVEKVAATIIRSEDDRPEQVLTVETTLGTKSADLLKALHVYKLPTEKLWAAPAQVNDALLTSANEIKLQAVPSEHEYETLHSFKFSNTPKQQLYIKIDKGLPGYGDYTLARDYVTLATTPEYPKEISFLHKGAILALAGEKKLSVLVRGLPAVKFEIARILPADINHLVTQTRGDFNNPHFIDQYNFNEKNISQIFSKMREFNQEDEVKLQYTALDLAEYLTKGTQRGLFLLKAEGWNTKDNVPLDAKATRLILVTDMGMIAKDNTDGTHDIFITSISQGAPVANVQVLALGKNGEPIQTQTTNAQGHAHFSSLTDFKDEHEPVVYIAHKEQDLSFIPYNKDDRQLNYSRFDVGGERTDLGIEQLTAFLFTERGVYRPGDKVHVGMVVKQAYAKPVVAGIPVEAVITDPRGTTVYKQKYNLPHDGFLNIDYQTGETAPTGQYNIDLYIIKDGNWAGLLGSTAITVEEFLPDRLRIRTQLLTQNQQGWTNPKDLQAKVSLWNLFGTPAQDRRVTGKIVLKPKGFHFKEYPNYIFIDPLLDPQKPPKMITQDLADAKTDKQGEAKFDLGLERFGKTTYELRFLAEGFEAEGGRGVSGQGSLMISPLDYLVGYKTDGDLNYIKQQSTRSIQFIAINPQLQQINLQGLQAKIIELRQVSTLIKKPDGTYAYQSVTQELPVSTVPFNIAAQGATFNVPTTKMGDYAITLVDAQGLEVSRVKFSVVGASNRPLPKNAELAVKLNKPEYTTGETIELQITAPYAGTGLITIERDKVYAFHWFKMDTTSTVQSIQIPKDFIGNGYINVAVARDWNSSEIFISPLSYSVVPFSVNRDAHNIRVSLNTPDTVQPGEQLSIGYKADKPGKIIVYAVDEGILQVTNYQTPDPLGYFFRKQALGVTTQQTLDQILPKFIQSRELSSVGGDALRSMIANNINPFKSKVDKPVVFWSGIMDVDTAERKINYPVPDYFNGSLKVMAVAVAADSVGASAKSLTVKGNVVINPNVPTFVAPGDEFTVSAGIANINGGNQPLTVSLTADANLEVLDSHARTVNIPQGQEQAVQFKLRAKNKLGAANVRFTVSAANKQNSIASSLSIRPASGYITSFNAGYTQDRQVSIPVARTLYPEFRDQEIAASASPLTLVKGLHRYLDDFPFNCTEQLVSKAFALIAFADQPVLKLSSATVQEKFNTIIQILRERQLANGSFSYWPGMGETEITKFISVYTMHFLTEAKQFGFSVPAELFDNGLAYLKEMASSNINSIEAGQLQAYAIYLLTRNEIVTTDYLTNLQLALEKDYAKEWRSDLTAVYMAATYQLLKKQDEAEQLIAGYKVGSNIRSTDFYKPLNSDAQYITILARHFPQRLQGLDENTLLKSLVDGVAKNYIDTLSAAYSALALKAYEQTISTKDIGRFTVSSIDGNNKRKVLANIDTLYQSINFDNTAKQIVIDGKTGKPYFYLMTQAGFDQQPATKAIKQGIEIYREYRDASGKVINQAKLGTEVEVHIQVRGLNNRYISNVAIVDLLPGGFEVVRDSVKRDYLDYADIREDRVISFMGIDGNTKELVYRIKATNIGSYTIPPIMAAAMYDPFVKGQGVAGKIAVIK